MFSFIRWQLNFDFNYYKIANFIDVNKLKCKNVQCYCYFWKICFLYNYFYSNDFSKINVGYILLLCSNQYDRYYILYINIRIILS